MTIHLISARIVRLQMLIRENLGNSSPCTVADLEKWYKDRNLPPYETTRFFIGIDYKKPRAFGIFKDGENFIVYKNKDNGQRVIRYKGTDEAFAVNELYLRLKEEIINQKNANAAGLAMSVVWFTFALMRWFESFRI